MKLAKAKNSSLKFCVFQTLSYATCMTDSVDGKYIFIGLPCGLVALDAIAQNFLGSWEEEGAEVTYIRSYLLGPEIYLINTIDDMGKNSCLGLR